MSTKTISPQIRERLDRVCALRQQLKGALAAANVDAGIALSALIEAFRDVAVEHPELLRQASQYSSIVSMQLLMQCAPPETPPPGTPVH